MAPLMTQEQIFLVVIPGLLVGPVLLALGFVVVWDFFKALI